MNYGTEDYSSNRLTPRRGLKLPLTQLNTDKELFTPIVIWNGDVFKIRPMEHLASYNENDFAVKHINDNKPFISGVFGFSEESYLVLSDDGKTYEFSCFNNGKVSEFDLGLTSSLRTISGVDYYILIFRPKKEGRARLQMGRLNIGKRDFSWKFQPTSTASGFALADDNKTLIVAEYKGGITALDVDTGSILWQKDVHTLGALNESDFNKNDLGLGSVNDNPHIYKDTIVMGYLFSYMVGIDLHTGKLKWRRKFIAEDLAYTTVSDDGRQYYLVHTSGSKETVLYEIDCTTGESINELQVELDDKTKKNFSSSVYSDVTDTHFWGVTSLGLLYAINLATGAMDWRYELKGALTGSPFFICNNRLYIVTHTEQFIFEGAGGYIVD